MSKLLPWACEYDLYYATASFDLGLVNIYTIQIHAYTKVYLLPF